MIFTGGAHAISCHLTKRFEGGALCCKYFLRGGTCPWCPGGSAAYGIEGVGQAHFAAVIVGVVVGASAAVVASLLSCLPLQHAPELACVVAANTESILSFTEDDETR